MRQAASCHLLAIVTWCWLILHWDTSGTNCFNVNGDWLHEGLMCTVCVMYVYCMCNVCVPSAICQAHNKVRTNFLVPECVLPYFLKHPHTSVFINYEQNTLTTQM